MFNIITKWIREHGLTAFFIVVAFGAGGLADNIRTSAQQSGVNEAHIREIQSSVNTLNRNMRSLDRGQDRILCRIDGKTAEICELQAEADLPDAHIDIVNGNGDR